MAVSRNERESILPGGETQDGALPFFTKAEIARRLGVTRTHVSLVLHGHRSSKRLLARIAQLKKEGRAQ